MAQYGQIFAVPPIANSEAFQATFTIAQQRDRDFLSFQLQQSFNTAVRHDATFERLTGTPFWRVCIRVVKLAHSKDYHHESAIALPPAGTRMELTRRTLDGMLIRCDGFVSSVSGSHDLVVIADSPYKLIFNCNGFKKVNIKLVHPDFLTNDWIAMVQALINNEYKPRFPSGVRLKSYFFGNYPERSSLDLFEHFQSAYIPREEEEDLMTTEVVNLPDDLMRYFRNTLDKNQLRAVEKSTSDIRNGDAIVRSLAGHIRAFYQQNETDPDVQKYLRLHQKLKYSATERADLHDLFDSLASRILSNKIDIVFTTGGLTSNKLLRTAFATDVLVVDEAALISVAKFTTYLTDEKTLSAVCLVADPHQRRPMSLSVSAKATEFEGGMIMSIF
ncbi:hypothetical protein W97_03575 [Coniosporium apollinis CBS 100218]|uniref:Uncharacterized protein n=1 Tax=Coniosporium apollinis (strain CBS 100218) TaxID=1168221 RepID=R7YRB2_CONA1|nr:uncharacterized protein W97_03575 [Coniosporium apollinis CBS 100218]EON64344.1 hypothetical protein W97_03575 [Coniosporium apollinis CBS 100218]